MLGSVVCSDRSNVMVSSISVIPFDHTENVCEGIKLLGNHNSSGLACLASVMGVGGCIIPYQSHHHTVILLILSTLLMAT